MAVVRSFGSYAVTRPSGWVILCGAHVTRALDIFPRQRPALVRERARSRGQIVIEGA